jgi:BirA family biotin operon repressor/biotin-[acetyl-CoA-carboxylase] ligase
MMLSKKEIEKKLTNISISVYSELDSTNSEAKRQAQSGASLPLLVCAESQTNGRGRLGRSFYSPKETGLYMSLAFEPKARMADAVTITGASAVAVALTIDELCKTDAKIKWVNDIYVSGKKVSGILAEAFTSGNTNIIVVGIGINCTTNIFPDDIKTRAGSVGEVDRNLLAAKITEKLLFYADNLSSRLWLDEYKKRSLVLGENINYTENGITKSAVAIGIDNNGGLIISENNKTKTLSTGEITVRIK